MPSRMTATNASTTSAVTEPLSSARSTAAWSSPRTLAACRRIQNSIQVTTDAARIMVSPSKSCSYGSLKLPTVANRTIPMIADSPRARPAPTNTFGK